METELIARDAELVDLLAGVRDGAGAVISGAPGVGKTALASAVAEHVARAGEGVEWVVATAASRRMPFGALAPLLVDDVTTLHPALVLGAVARRLANRGGRRPPLLVVDDAHLLDDQSAATVLGLLTSGAARVLATVRGRHPAPDAIATLWKDGFVAATEIAPFDAMATRQFLAYVLGGEVAAGAATLLWAQTHGNALYLRELARAAQANGRLVNDAGVWMWQGGFTVPPSLADLLDRRFDGLTPAGLDALGALVMGEPLALETLGAVVGEGAVAELENHGLVEAAERDGRVWYRVAHPLLAMTAERHLTPTRRRRLADALVAVAGDSVDIVRRGTWQLDASGPADAGVLLAAARAVLLTRPALTLRLAERALASDEGPSSALVLADAHAELGQVSAARAAQALAVTRVRTEEDRVAIFLNEVSLTTFSERRPDQALEALAARRWLISERFHAEVDSCAALLSLFAARPADALARAEQVLATRPRRAARIRAATARVGALALVDRSKEAMVATRDLLADLAAGASSPYAQGVAHIAAGLARFIVWDEQRPPATDPAARGWPVPPSAVGDVDQRVAAVSYPLFDGAHLVLEGHARAAIPALREAFAQQRHGEGLLRSEASAMLVVALAAAGAVDEAERVLAEHTPDRLAIYPGLEGWARSVLAAVAGRPESVDLALQAAAEARAVGGTVSAVAYLADAARFGGARAAARELDRIGYSFEAAITSARALGIRARASGDGKAMLEAAEAHAAIGITGQAAEFAELAVAALSRDASAVRQRAQALAGDMHRRLGRVESGPAPVVALTRRELEVARLAAKGMTDRDIAAVLVVSVRTVESHLAAAYRKLTISSRHGLRTALANA